MKTDALLDKLKTLDLTNFDIDVCLDQRDIIEFDAEWIRLYEIVLAHQPSSQNDASAPIREQAFRIAFAQTEDDEIAGYISDDFGLIYDCELLEIQDEWLDKLMKCYENGIFPCGKL